MFCTNYPLLVLLFGALAIIAEVTVMVILKKGWGNDSVRIVGLTLIITCIMVLVTMDIKSEYLTSLIGLFGSIAGYLLGKKNDKES